MQYRKGSCSRCQGNDVLIVKRLPSGDLCNPCNISRLNDAKPKVKPSYYLKANRKPTGELLLFNSIWATREHKSFVSGEWLGDEMNVCYMAHVLPKAQNRYPLFKLLDLNIVLLSWDEHHLFDNMRWKVENDPLWKPLFTLEAELKEEYKKITI